MQEARGPHRGGWVTEKELLELASDRPCPPGPIWSEHVYGLGKWLKRYAGVPDELPLGAQIDHGPGNWDVPHKMDLESRAPVLLFHHEKNVAVTQPFVAKPCLVMGSPFVHCRWLNGYQIARDALGTVAFPVHSTHHTTNDMDWGRYCEDLRRIPIPLQPVTVCLYWKDILNGLHRVFLREGFDVVCAGHMYDPLFTERFYGILSRHRYATSNDIGSQAFYTVEMGLPFFVWGEQEFSWYNTGGESAYPVGKFVWKDIAAYYQLDEAALQELPDGQAGGLRPLLGRRTHTAGEFLDLLRTHAGISADSPMAEALAAKAKRPFGRPWPRELFREPRERITAEQQAFVSHYLGLRDAQPPRILRQVLWQASEVMHLGNGPEELLDTCRRARDRSFPAGRQSCPACGTFETVTRELAPPAFPSAVGTFEICRECGTAFRSQWALHPPAACRPLDARSTGGGRMELRGLEAVEDPVDALKAAARDGAGEILALVPGLGPRGMETIRADAGIRTLFTVTGMRRALARSGFRALGVWRDEAGTLRAVARAGLADYPAQVVPPWDPVDGLPALLAPRPAMPTPEFDPVFRLVERNLLPEEREALLLRLFELIRKHPQGAPLLRAIGLLHLRAGEWAKAEQWLGLASEAARPGEYPREELNQVHDRLGVKSPAQDQGPSGSKENEPEADGQDESAGRFIRVLELMHSDRDVEALDEIQAALAAGVRNPDFRFANAVVLVRLGRREEAVAILSRLLSDHPEQHQAKTLLSGLAG